MNRHLIRGAGLGVTIAALSAMTLTTASPAHAAGTASQDTRQAGILAEPSAVFIMYQADAFLNDNASGQTLTAGTDQNGQPVPLSVSWSGTGFFVSNDGFIVTAAHVAAPSDNDIRSQLVQQYILSASNCQAQGNCDAVVQHYYQGLMLSTSLNGLQTTIKVYTQDQTDPSRNFVGYTAELRASSPSTSHDIAVIKVALANTPALPLGDSDAVQIGDSVSVIGYPSGQMSSSNRATLLVPTVTSGAITARRQSGSDFARDANLLQTDAAIEHGNSGGPGVDAKGDAIGLVSFGDNQSVKFLIPANDIKDVMRQAGVDATPAQIDTLWRDGMRAYAAADYSTASHLLSQCAAISKLQVGCSDYATKAAAQAGHSGSGTTTQSAGLSLARTTTGGSTLPVSPLVLILAAVGCAAAVAAGLVARSRRSSRLPAPPAITSMVAPAAPAPSSVAPAADQAWMIPPPPPVHPQVAQRLAIVCPGCGNYSNGQSFCGHCGRQQAA